LVTCAPDENGGEGYAVSHCGELLDPNVRLANLSMEFNTESIQAEKAVQTHRMIISAEDNYRLETLTAGMAKFNRPKNATP
jgi:hypothetical protein